MTREQRIILFQLLPAQAQYVEVLSRSGDTLLLAWRRKPWSTTQGMARVQAVGSLAALDRGEHATRLSNGEKFTETLNIEEISL